MTKLTVVQLKILIFEPLQAQNELAKFLKMAAQRYGHLLNEEEVDQGARLMQRVSSTIDRLTEVIDTAVITLADDSYRPKDSDDNFARFKYLTNRTHISCG